MLSDGGGARLLAVAESTTPCPFCEIVSAVSPPGSPPVSPADSLADEVFRDSAVVAFLDRRPLFHGHTLVVPTRHVVTLADLDSAEVGPFFERVQLISREMPVALGCAGTFVANNNVVSQSVAHLHVHVVPRAKGDGLRGFFWPRTSYREGESADVARRLKAAFEAAWAGRASGRSGG